MPLSDLWEAPAGSELDDSQLQDEREEELKRLKKVRKTAKARTASLLSRLQKRLAKEQSHDPDPEDSAKASFQRAVLASSSTKWDPCEDVEGEGLHAFETANGRRRGVFLYFKWLAVAVRRVFGWTDVPGEQRLQIPHVLTVNINDDTNMKLGSGKRGSSEVQSVMSNIQQHVVFPSSIEMAGPAEPICFSLHQPIVTLERADARTLYADFMGWILYFCGYVGWRLRAWGFPEDLFQEVRQQTFCFVGDALRVNDALFNRMVQAQVNERKKQRGRSQTMLLQIHCGIHQAALTRKVLALGFHGYWSTVVRLSHLFEGRSFRQRFRAALAKVVTENFHYELVKELPAELQEWHAFKVSQLKLYSDSGHMGGGGKPPGKPSPASKRLRAMIRHMQIDNGDARSDMFVHWCTGPACCAGGRDKALSAMLESFFDLFDYMCVPLLYRWKHAAQANNFVRDGFFWHRILPRALEAIPGMKCESNKVLDALNAWTQAARHASTVDTEELSHIVEELMQQDMSYAEQNAKRFRQVNEAFKKPDVDVIVNIVDFLMIPLDSAINRLLARTSCLRTLRFGTDDHDAQFQLKSQAMTAFLDWADGSFGMRIVADYMRSLKTGQLAGYCSDCKDAAIIETCFQLIVFAMPDTWKRFCFAVNCFPWKLFALARCDEQDFHRQWGQFCHTKFLCPSCVDSGFGFPFLESVDFSTFGLDHIASGSAVKEIQDILCNIATFSPLATDTVENMHGQNQNQVSRFRGKSKAPAAAAEMSVLARLKNEHAYVKAIVMEKRCQRDSRLPTCKSSWVAERACSRSKRARTA